MCFGCGQSFRVLDYIKHMEGLSHKEAVSLLARVYMIDINNSVLDEDSKLVQNYRSSLLSNEFRELMECGYERTSKREDNATIDRVRRGEHIEFDGKKDKGKRLVLEIYEVNK